MKTVRLIVYGTLMRGESNHVFCRNALRIVPCTITGTLYDTGKGYPAFVPEGKREISAELIELPEEDLPAVDALDDYPHEYDRKLFSARLENGASAEGWIYLMNELPPEAEIIACGSWTQYRENSL